MHDVKTIQYQGVEVIDDLMALMDMINKVVPDLLFKPKELTKWGVDPQKYPNGVCESVLVFHKSDPNNFIGRLDISSYFHIQNIKYEPKYGISSININDGRNTYRRNEGQYKYSIHPKNIVRVAKKAFKPFTFKQIADRNAHNFNSEIQGIRSKAEWDIRQGTSDTYDVVWEDVMHLHAMGYQPKSDKFKRVMDYILEKKDFIQKYKNYSPDHYFVLVRPDSVMYQSSKHKESDPIVVPSKDNLPEDIKGKLFVLDITDSQSFVEDVGLKENDGAYWIVA